MLSNDRLWVRRNDVLKNVSLMDSPDELQWIRDNSRQNTQSRMISDGINSNLYPTFDNNDDIVIRYIREYNTYDPNIFDRPYQVEMDGQLRESDLIDLRNQNLLIMGDQKKNKRVNSDECIIS